MVLNILSGKRDPQLNVSVYRSVRPGLTEAFHPEYGLLNKLWTKNRILFMIAALFLLLTLTYIIIKSSVLAGINGSYEYSYQNFRNTTK